MLCDTYFGQFFASSAWLACSILLSRLAGQSLCLKGGWSDQKIKKGTLVVRVEKLSFWESHVKFRKVVGICSLSLHYYFQLSVIQKYAMVIFWCPTKSLYKIILDVYTMEYKFVSTSCWMFALFPKNLKRHISKCPVTTSYRVPINEVAHSTISHRVFKNKIHIMINLLCNLFLLKSLRCLSVWKFFIFVFTLFFTLYIIKRTLLLYNVEQFVGPNI